MARMRAYSASITPKGYEKRQREAQGNATIGSFCGFMAAFLISMVIAPEEHLLHVFGGGIGAGIGYLVTLGWLLHRLSVEQSVTTKTRR